MVLNPNDFSVITNEGKRIVEPGIFTVTVEGGQANAISLSNKTVLTEEVVIK